MEVLEQDMDMESIIRKYDGCEFSEEIGEILAGRNIPFEVIDGIVHIKVETFEHSITKNVLWSLINENLKIKGMECEAFMGMRTLRGEAYPKDFLKPDISVLDLSEACCGSNGMYAGIPNLIVEVMPEDRSISYQKRLVYQEMGIPEYWVVDLVLGGITQYILENGSYGIVSTMHIGGTIKHHRCGLELDVEEVFALIKQEIEFLIKPADEESLEDKDCCQRDRIDAKVGGWEQIEEEIREIKDKLQKVQEENAEMRKRIRFLEEELAKGKGE